MRAPRPNMAFQVRATFYGSDDSGIIADVQRDHVELLAIHGCVVVEDGA
jgi:hypothetical protein